MSEFRGLEMVRATEIVENPSVELAGKVRTIYDISRLRLGPWNNLEKALNILYNKGWRPVCMAISGTIAYVIIEKR